MLRKVHLFECHFRGTVQRWLASGGMPALVDLSIEECTGDDLDDGLGVLASSDIATQLETLSVTGVSPETLETLLRSSHFCKLETIGMGPEIQTIATAFDNGPVWPQLESLQLRYEVDESESTLFEAISPVRFPSLKRLESINPGSVMQRIVDRLSERFDRPLECAEAL